MTAGRRREARRRRAAGPRPRRSRCTRPRTGGGGRPPRSQRGPPEVGRVQLPTAGPPWVRPRQMATPEKKNGTAAIPQKMRKRRRSAPSRNPDRHGEELTRQTGSTAPIPVQAAPCARPPAPSGRVRLELDEQGPRREAEHGGGDRDEGEVVPRQNAQQPRERDLVHERRGRDAGEGGVAGPHARHSDGDDGSRPRAGRRPSSRSP